MHIILLLVNQVPKIINKCSIIPCSKEGIDKLLVENLVDIIMVNLDIVAQHRPPPSLYTIQE